MGDNAICTSLLRIDPNVHVYFLLDSPAFIETIKGCWMFFWHKLSNTQVSTQVSQGKTYATTFMAQL